MGDQPICLINPGLSTLRTGFLFVVFREFRGSQSGAKVPCPTLVAG